MLYHSDQYERIRMVSELTYDLSNVLYIYINDVVNILIVYLCVYRANLKIVIAQSGNCAGY